MAGYFTDKDDMSIEMRNILNSMIDESACSPTDTPLGDQSPPTTPMGAHSRSRSSSLRFELPSQSGKPLDEWESLPSPSGSMVGNGDNEISFEGAGPRQGSPEASGAQSDSSMDALTTALTNEKLQETHSRQHALHQDADADTADLMASLITAHCKRVFAGGRSDADAGDMCRQAFLAHLQEHPRLQEAVRAIRAAKILLLQRLTHEELCKIPATSTGHQKLSLLPQMADLEVKVWVYLLLAHAMGLFTTGSDGRVSIMWDVDALHAFFERCLTPQDIARDAQENNRPWVRTIILNACSERSDRPKSSHTLAGTVQMAWFPKKKDSPRRLQWLMEVAE
jgi:hypothetical protein